MAILTAGGHDVLAGSITLPRVGAWTADLELDADAELEGPVTIEIAEGESLVGTARGGELTYGYMRPRVVAGADGLGKEARPRHYTNPAVRTVLGDLAAAAGETLSGTISAALLNARLTAWTVLVGTVGEQLGAFVRFALPPGTAWRYLPDGTLWVGAETWPASGTTDWRELDRFPREGRLELGLDSATLLPGTMLGADRLAYIEHRIRPSGVTAKVWLDDGAITDPMKRGLFGVARAAHPALDYGALYRAVVLAQSGDRATVDVKPDDSRLPLMSQIPLKLSIPGATVKIAAGAGVLIGWENGNPQHPQAFLFDKGATALVLSMAAERLELGGEGLVPLLEQVVIGKTPCQFTGAPHAAMSPLSARVFAKET
jgi:hypothetical protein